MIFYYYIEQNFSGDSNILNHTVFISEEKKNKTPILTESWYNKQFQKNNQL